MTLSPTATAKGSPPLDTQIGASVLCVDRYIDLLKTELAAWCGATNTDQCQVQCHFTTSDARVKLCHLYPTISSDTLLIQEVKQDWPLMRTGPASASADGG